MRTETISKETKQDLIEADKMIKRHLTANNGCWDSKIFMGVMHQPSSGKLWSQVIADGDAQTTAWYAYVHRLQQRGYIKYIPKKVGGTGWMVNQEYVIGTDQEIKTTIIDRTANIASKLAPAKEYDDFHQMLITLTAKEPSLTVKELLEFLNKRSDYRALATRPDNAGKETLRIQQELEQYYVDYARLLVGDNQPKQKTVQRVSLAALSYLPSFNHYYPSARPNLSPHSW